MNEVKKDTFRSKGKRLCDNDDMIRVVLDMTRREYFVSLKPLLETAHNSDYAKCKSIGCQFYDEKFEFNCCANESLCEKFINNQHFA